MSRLITFLLLIPFPALGQTGWINEIHYDNSGVDTLEFVEVIWQGPTDSIMIYLYDGISGLPYDSAGAGVLLTGESAGDFTVYTWFPVAIQNGPDALALTYANELIQFISYEGPVTGMGGPAEGSISYEFPLSEGSRPAGTAIGLTGSGMAARHFWWAESPHSPGQLNDGQFIVTTPVIRIFSPGSIDFGTVPNGEQSLPEMIVVAGANLSDSVILLIPSGFEVSEDPAFLLPITNNYAIQLTNDHFGPDTLFLRFVPGPESGMIYSGEFLAESTGVQESVTLNGKEGPYILPNTWINEIHYDNISTDENEFVEIVIADKYIPEIPYLSLHFYNGNNRLEYKSSVAGDWTFGYYDPAGFQYLVADVPGIQNGVSDGILLAHRSRPVQFISYEGVLTALDGPAEGLTSIDIGVMEDVDAPLNSSLQLVGTGGSYSDFTWNYFPGNQTRSMPNHDQVLPVVIDKLAVEYSGNASWVTWVSMEEYRNAGYTIEHSEDGELFFPLDHISPASSIPFTYRIRLPDGLNGYIRLVQTDWNGRENHLGILKIETIPDKGRLFVYDLHGRLVYTGEAGTDMSAGSLPLKSGMYIAREINGTSVRAWRFFQK